MQNPIVVRVNSIISAMPALISKVELLAENSVKEAAVEQEQMVIRTIEQCISALSTLKTASSQNKIVVLRKIEAALKDMLEHPSNLPHDEAVIKQLEESLNELVAKEAAA